MCIRDRDWDILYLTVIVTGGNTLIQDSYEITVTWPDRMVSQYFFEVWKGAGSTWVDSIGLGTTYNHPPGTVLISIERRSTGQVVQTYESVSYTHLIDYADFVLAFWDGKSRGTKYVIDNCKKRKKKVRVFLAK